MNLLKLSFIFSVCVMLYSTQLFSGGDMGLKKYEKDYQKEWCSRHKGKTEYVLQDRTRCDCLTATHAIEFDYAKKFYEAIGQSLYYSLQTGKRAGVVLILTKKKQYKYWVRLNSTILHFNLPISTWIIKDYKE